MINLFKCCVVLSIHLMTINGQMPTEMPLNVPFQIKKNTNNIYKLDQAQYKFVHQLTKLQDDINDLEEEINKCKAVVKRIQNIMEKNSSLNTKQIFNVFQGRFGDSMGGIENYNEIDDIFFISPDEGFIWKIDNVSSVWNRTDVQLVSKPFYSDGQFGYKIRLKLSNLFGKIRIILEILNGEFDSLLPWPFNNEMEISLLSQEYPYIHYTERNVNKPDTCLHRPWKSMKRYSHIYSIALRKILSRLSKNERDPLIINCQFNNGTDINDDKIFNKKITWEVDGFQQKLKQKNVKALKHSFYTGDFGYNLQLVLYPNGVSDNGDLDLFLMVLKGDYDDLLWWPFKFNVSVSILDRNNTKNMCPEDDNLKTSKSHSELAAFIFFNKSEIQKFYSSIIKGNQMFIKFYSKAKLSDILNTKTNNEDRKYKSIFWLLRDCDKLRKQSGVVSSSVFALSLFGYNIKLSVYMNGERSWTGKYASIYIYIVNGTYDHILPWPFRKQLSISILDKDNVTIDGSMNIMYNTEFSTSLKPINDHPILVAYCRFMNLTDKSIAKYVIEDSLRIKLQVTK